MTLKELTEICLQALKHPEDENLTVCVPLEYPSGIGGTLCVSVTHAYRGIDWDADSFFLHPEEGLLRIADIPSLHEGDSIPDRMQYFKSLESAAKLGRRDCDKQARKLARFHDEQEVVYTGNPEDRHTGKHYVISGYPYAGITGILYMLRPVKGAGHFEAREEELTAAEGQDK